MARGRKSVDAIAGKAIEAQPSFGQIKPIRGEVFAGWSVSKEELGQPRIPGRGNELMWEKSVCCRASTHIFLNTRRDIPVDRGSDKSCQNRRPMISALEGGAASDEMITLICERIAAKQ